MPLPEFPTIKFADVNGSEIHTLASWLRDSLTTVEAEIRRRDTIRDEVHARHAWQIKAAGPDDPRWTPQPWDAARLAAGPAIGLRGFIVQRCPDGCEQIDGQPRWELYINGGGPVWTCLPREHLRPVPSVRHDGRMWMRRPGMPDPNEV